MREFKNLKMEVQEYRKALEEATANVQRLTQKRDEIKLKLSESDQQLHEARSAMETAVTKCASDDIPDEAELGVFQTRVSALGGRREAISKVLEVTENDLTTAVSKKQEIAHQLREKERYAWIKIGNIELNKAAPILRRAFFALCRGDKYNSDRRSNSDNRFLTGPVREAFCPGAESYETTTDRLSKEYFG